MIIISQEKDEILNFNNIMNIQVTNCEEDGYLISAGFIVGGDDNYRDLGYYKTEERAKEVLQEIVNATIETRKSQELNNLFGGAGIIPSNTYYEMPED